MELGHQLLSSGLDFLQQFRRSGQMPHLGTAISLLRRGHALLPVHHPNRSNISNVLGSALAIQFDMSGQREDLKEAISFHRDALELQPAPHPIRSITLNQLAAALTTQFEQSGQQEDLAEGISFLREALELAHPDRSSPLNNLASALTIQFEQLGQQEDLNAAISLLREVLDLVPALHPDRYTSLHNLANVLLKQFNQLGQQDDLDEAISFAREAVKLLPAPHPSRSSSLSGLACTLRTQFEQSGQREHLDEAMSLLREALELLPATHPSRPISLNTIANTLLVRFEQSGQRDDLDEAMSFHREALELRPAPHPDRSMSLVNLAGTFVRRFEQTGQAEDLGKAMSFYREALGLQPAPHPGRSMSMNNLGAALERRYRHSGQQEDLNKTISCYQDVLELIPPGHPFRSAPLNNLAVTLATRYNLTGQREDLDVALSTHYQSLDALVSGNPDICGFSANLGRTLLYSYFGTHESEYLDKAIAVFRVAVTCEVAPPSLRFYAAKEWARHADSKHESALEAYQAAVQLLPRLAMLSLDLESRQQALISGSDGLARDAAACAIRLGQYDKAIELLEEGRAVFWSQALQLRTPMINLHAAAPELEAKLRRISIALEQGSFPDALKSPSDASQKVIMEQEASRLRRLNDDWLATLEDVRCLDTFQDFLRPSRIFSLQRAAANGPIVVLNASKNRCDALILKSTGVHHVPFPNLGFVEVSFLVKLIRYAIAQDGRDAFFLDSNSAHVKGLVQQMPFISDTLQLLRLPLERHVKRISDISEYSNDIFRYVLGVLWESVVKPVIQSLDLKKSDIPQNLWWCPTGPFAFLPIHAAGMFIAERAESVFDYIVSSYTPTIGALSSNIPPVTDAFKMMLVIQPDTTGQKSLPCTLDELRKIEAGVPNNDMIRLVGAFVKDVISRLPEASIVHFACHGQQNTCNPLESSLFLQDGQLKVSQIMQQSMPNPSLAFLSACETAMGDENLPDEVIHLGATLLFAGFRGVVATMWSIADPDGPKIADTFYENLFEATSSTTNSSQPDNIPVARALHLAVAKLRSENVPFARWVPFVHLGR